MGLCFRHFLKATAPLLTEPFVAAELGSCPTTSNSLGVLLHAIRVVSRGDSVLAPSVTRRLIESFAPAPVLTESDAARLSRLTDRELAVFV